MNYQHVLTISRSSILKREVIFIWPLDIHLYASEVNHMCLTKAKVQLIVLVGFLFLSQVK